jgi:ribosomal protein S18 acetylase RimI-like enzyme
LIPFALIARPAFWLRPAGPEDRTLLLAIFASSREDELAVLPWGEEQKRALVELQYDFQHAHYRSNHPEAGFDVVMFNGEAAGRFYVDRSGPEIHVIEVTLLPPHRGCGPGTALLEDLLAEADSAGRLVTLSVDHANRARSLYDRLEFRVVEDSGVYLRMQRAPREPVTRPGQPP